MSRLFELLRGFVLGNVSMGRFLLFVLSGAILWMVSTAIGGVIQLEAGKYWEDSIQQLLRRPVPLFIPCSILPLLLWMAFTVGLCVSARFRPHISPDRSGGETTQQAEGKSEMNGDDSIALEPPVGSATGELLSERVKLRDGEITPAQFASLVLYRLNQGLISDGVARRLLREFCFDVSPIDENAYTLVRRE